jgi:hypothetical protein
LGGLGNTGESRLRESLRHRWRPAFLSQNHLDLIVRAHNSISDDGLDMPDD